MNKVFCKKGVLFSLILTGYLILFNTSCGLDTFYVIDGPTNTIHKPDCNSIDYSDSYFEFYTVDKEYDTIKFLGTDVYYKIYKSPDRLRSEYEDLIAISNRDDTASAAAEKMIQTYRFQPLRAAGYEGKDVLFPTVQSNQKIYIRLSNYTVSYPAKITVDNDNIYNAANTVIPVRNLATRPSFNFQELRTSNSSLLPKSDDVDVNTTGSNSSDTNWYVSLFAVAIGQDSSYSAIYSNILHLGSVRIPTE